ncbi:MAG: ABC transporter ATP-binding protein [Anaerolineae bacterium]
MTESAAIRFENVSKRFALDRVARAHSLQELVSRFFRAQANQNRQSFLALDDVSFDVEQGATVGFIGANGAGKSTALKLVARILEPTTGSVEVNGRVGALLELGAGFHPDLTGRENVYLNASVMGLDRQFVRDRFSDIVDFSELGDFIDLPVKHYSSGMYVRLGFSVAVHLRPDILLIDEVLAVGDQAFQHKCLDRLAEFRQSGVTIVLVTHNLDAVESLCDTAIWFDRGRIAGSGRSRDVIVSYLAHVTQREMAQANIGEKDTRVESSKQRRRWGSGEMEITDVELVDESGHRTQLFSTSGSMEIRLHYRCRREINEPVFGLAIHDEHGVHVCGPNTRFAGHKILRLNGAGVVSYYIPKLRLLEGSYLISVSAENARTTKTYDYQDRLYPFWVQRGDSREIYGVVTLDGEWKIPEEDIGADLNE